MKKSLGIYIHIPFCLKKCPYCDFCSFPDKKGLYEEYTEELIRRIKSVSAVCSEHRVDTVYFGGGTPTLLPLNCFEKLADTLLSSFDVAQNAEVTAECNPATVSLDYLSELRKIGVNRLSIGLQSVHENELKALGRAHSFEDFIETYGWARSAGFENISADLMYGIPEQTVDSFKKSLMALAALSPQHISAYGLKIEEGTPFYEMRDDLSLPDEDTEYEMYLSMSEMLGDYGYEKYEISNFSKKGFESKHNLRYWQGGEYLGFGVAAHSYFFGERFGNSRDIGAFLRGESIECERSSVDEKEKLREYIMLSMRLSSGMELSEFERKAKKSFVELYGRTNELIKNGYIKNNDGHISFTDKGFFVSNTILSDMLETIDI